MEKKYELTDNVINYNGRTLYRIRALRAFYEEIERHNNEVRKIVSRLGMSY